ncbi:MAG: response regulator [Deltaproteobacteria bacterium]|nr:response regulator [Deltaproteobacteria bacterium]
MNRLLQHAQRLLKLANGADILAATCREVLVATGAERVFGSCSLPRQTWQQGVHVVTDRDDSQAIVEGAARSALFAIHRRAVMARERFDLERSDEVASVFAGLAVAERQSRLSVIPILHRTGKVWGELVLVGDSRARVDEDVADLVQLATYALENAERLMLARRDQDRLLLLSEATDEALYDWDFDTRSFWWGGGITKLTGSDVDPIESSPRWKHERIHPEDLERVRESFDHARFSGALRWEADYQFRRYDGTYCEVEDRAFFLRDAEGRSYRAIGSIRDVTAVKHLLVRERDARAVAEKASRAKDEFLAMLGHELRNPLAPIVTGLELLRMRGTIDVQRDLPVIQRQAQHLIRLVDDLLDSWRITHGKIELKRERFEIATAIAAGVELATPLIVARDHELDLRVPSGLVVQADRARLAQAIGNLVTNAAKYTEPRGKITISAQRVGAEVEVTVVDTGVGIAPDMLPTIFNMFVQERQSLDRAQGGLGLGLAIVRNLVELHGGTVQAHSAGRGCGTQMTIRIPADAAAEMTPRTEPRRAELPRGRRIMVVDDNEDAAELLSAVLEQLGNTTRVAHDADGALAIVDEFAPDLAVLDIGLPIVDGYELARRLRQRPQRMSLIALTGYGQSSDKERASKAGFDAHLVKPVAIDALQALIAKL